MTIKESRRPAFEQAVIDRMKEGGFLEVEIRVECLARSGDGYYDGSVDAYWHYWNAALDGVVMELPLAWKPQGEANFYAITENGNWLAIVQLNGELLREAQEEWMRLFTGQNMRIIEAKAQGVVMPERMDIPGVQADFYGSRTLDEIARLSATPVQQPKCKTCNDNGMIGGPSFYAPDEGGEPCPHCAAAPDAVEVLRAVQEQFNRFGERFPDGFDSRVFRWVDDAVAAYALDAPAQQVSVPDEPWTSIDSGDLDSAERFIKTQHGNAAFFYKDAQTLANISLHCIREVRAVRAMLAAAPAAGEPSAEMVQAARAAFRMDVSPVQAMHDALCAALAAAPAALAGKAYEIGIYGKAYDLPSKRRAYTYDEQPDNVVASRLACALSGVEPGGDSIDHGLSLLNQLQEAGFGVFELATPRAQGVV